MSQSALPFDNCDTIRPKFKTSFLNYEIYHDESNVDGYWHGMLLIPSEQKQIFFEMFREERKKINYFNRFSFKEIDSKGEKYKLADAWLSLAIGFLRSRINKEKYIVERWDEEGKRIQPSVLPGNYMGAKFILFRVVDDHANMAYLHEKTSKIETTLRIALKGGLHFFGSDEHPINIEKIHFDGHEHLLRKIDKKRVIDKIDCLRAYCSFDKRSDLIDDRSGNPEKPNCQDLIDCEFLILVDLLIGAFRIALGGKCNKHRYVLAKHPNAIISRMREGPKRMRNSRWSSSFCLSECYLDTTWHFQPISDQKKVSQMLNQQELGF